MRIGRFFAGIGVLIWRPSDGKYLLLRRSAEKDFASGTWECVTGRVDQGEGFPEAARREVREELGVEAQIDFIVGTTHFYRGEMQPENELIGVQFCCSSEAPETLHLSAEHSEMRWVTAGEAQALLFEGHWLLKAIRRAETMRALSPASLLEHYRMEGLEL